MERGHAKTLRNQGLDIAFGS